MYGPKFSQAPILYFGSTRPDLLTDLHPYRPPHGEFSGTYYYSGVESSIFNYPFKSIIKIFIFSHLNINQHT